MTSNYPCPTCIKRRHFGGSLELPKRFTPSFWVTFYWGRWGGGGGGGGGGCAHTIPHMKISLMCKIFKHRNTLRSLIFFYRKKFDIKSGPHDVKNHLHSYRYTKLCGSQGFHFSEVTKFHDFFPEIFQVYWVTFRGFFKITSNLF